MGWTEAIIAAGKGSAFELRRRLDSWSNALTGLNTARDKTTSTLPGYIPLLLPQVLESMYHTDDIATRIVAALPDECFREDWTVANTADEEAESDQIHEQTALLAADFKMLDVRRKLKEAMIWGRLYGLGAVVLGADDDLPVDMPLDPLRVRSVRFLTVIDKRDLTPWSWYSDLDEPQFGDIAQYMLQPVGVYMGMPYEGMGALPPIYIHESRLIRFGGELTSKRERLRNQGCDYSVLQKCFRALQLTNNNWQSASTLLADAGQGVFKIRGLIDMIAQQPDVMTSRMQLVDLMRSTLRAIILDAGDAKGAPTEDFTRVPTPFTGIPEMLVQTWNRLACAARMPLMVLMGSKPAGLNSDGEEDLEWWYNSIEGTQREIILPACERILRLLAITRGFQNADSWTVKFGKLRRSSPKDEAEIFLKRAQGYEVMTAKTGIWTPTEVALSLDADPTGNKIVIDTDARKEMLAAELDVQAAELQQRHKAAKLPPERPDERDRTQPAVDT